LNADNGARLESALARTEADTDGAAKAAAALTGQLKRAQKAARLGILRDLERALEAAEELAGALRDSVRAARAGWRFDDRAYLETGAFTAELLDTAQAAGVRVVEQDDRLLSYPSLVRVLPGDAAIEIDRKRQRSIRPSVVVESLRAAQSRPPRFRPEPFLETLLRAYRFVAAENGREVGGVVRLVDVHRVLTLLPGTSYTKQEFARDLYLLDESGVTQTREGLTVAFAAATGTKGGSSLSAVTRAGDVKPYYGVAFRA
jgi:hypothetical protein